LERLVRIDLDERALTFIQGHLSLGSTLCGALSRLIEGQGQTFTFLPPDKIDAAYRFHAGGILQVNVDRSARRFTFENQLVPVESLNSIRAQRVVDFLKTHKDGIAIVSEAVVRISDPKAREYMAENRGFRIGEEIYYFLNGRDSIDAVEGLLKRTDYIWHSVVVLCDPHKELTTSDLSSANSLSDVVSMASEVIVGAYDREGFVVWSRGGFVN
jgi:hypothetical protein